MNTILILDDDPMAVELAQNIFEENGYRVIPCTDPKTALIAFKREPIDIALVDLALPVMTGMEFIKRCKNIQKNCSFIVISGYLSMEAFISLQDLGVVECFNKPFDVELIVKAISEVIGNPKNL